MLVGIEGKRGALLYRIKKILNNNVAIALDDAGEEVIVTGKGLGFGNKPGDILPERSVHRVYTACDGGGNRRLQAIFAEIPYACIRVAEHIVDFASAALGQQLGQNLVVPLADHINFAIERTRAGTYQQNLLSQEIENFYPAECVIGRQGLALISDELGVDLDPSEAASIAFHIINNAGSGNTALDTSRIIQGMEGMLAIIQDGLGIRIPADSSRYARLVTHLKFLMRRVITDSQAADEVGPLFLNTDDASVRNITVCVERVASFLADAFDYDISEAERLYLFVHIVAIAQAR